MHIFLENLDKFHTLLVESPIWWGVIISALPFTGYNFYYMLSEIIKGMPCLSGDENLQDSWVVLKFVYFILLIPIIIITSILQIIFPNEMPQRSPFGLPLATPEQLKFCSLVILLLVLLSIILTIVFKMLIYYKSKNKDSKCQKLVQFQKNLIR